MPIPPILNPHGDIYYQVGQQRADADNEGLNYIKYIFTGARYRGLLIIAEGSI